MTDAYERAIPMYRIKDWDKRFENNRTRQLKHLDWVPIPNKMDGDGYTDLVEHPNAAAHLGAWLAIVEIASRQDPRGTLPEGRHGLCKTLARISRLPAEIFQEVIPRLISEVEWLEEVPSNEPSHEGAGSQHDGAGLQHDDAPRVRAGREEKGREGNGTEWKHRAPEPIPIVEPSELGIEGWDELIEAATKAGMSLDPSPAGDLCQKVWRYRDFERRQQLIQGILDRTESGQYSPEEPQFTPTLENYLSKNRDRETPRPRNRGQPNGGRKSADELNQRGIERAIREAKERKEKWKTTSPHLT